MKYYFYRLILNIIIYTLALAAFVLYSLFAPFFMNDLPVILFSLLFPNVILPWIIVGYLTTISYVSIIIFQAELAHAIFEQSHRFHTKLNILYRFFFEDETFLIETIRIEQSNTRFGAIPDKYRSNEAFLLKAVKVFPDIFVFFSSALTNNRNFIFKAIKTEPQLYNCLPEHIINHHGVALLINVIENVPDFLVGRALNEPLRNLLLQIPSDDWKRIIADQPSIVGALLDKFNNGELIEFFGISLKKEDDFISFVERDGMLLGKFGTAVKASRDIVKAAVKQNGLAIQFASNQLNKDPEIVKLAFEQNSDSIEFVRLPHSVLYEIMPHHVFIQKKGVVNQAVQNLLNKSLDDNYDDDKKVKLQSIATDLVVDNIASFLTASDAMTLFKLPNNNVKKLSSDNDFCSDKNLKKLYQADFASDQQKQKMLFRNNEKLPSLKLREKKSI
ncbi:MAG: DUF4116 domain-containing protein [Pseudomonadota bacterium]|nr:DUF4116 domain-containing protein [Pseudomonadota bacterium]